MKAVILQSNYFPWKGYFDLVHDTDLFIFYDETQYTSRDWRNRNQIYSPAYRGLKWLTVPVHKSEFHKKISEVKFQDGEWQKDHLRVLSLAYKGAPYFQQLQNLIQEILEDHQWESLSEMNQFSIKKISTLIGIKTKFMNSKDLELQDGKVKKIIGILKQVNADEYITGPSARAYLEGSESHFSENGIKLTYKVYPDYPEYQQLAEPFVHQVSILDLIANIEIGKIKNHIWNT